MPRLDSPLPIKGLTLKNRLNRSATWEALADSEGRVTEPLKQMMGALAQGGLGLITTGLASVVKPTSAKQLAIDNDESRPGLKELTGVIKEGGAGAAIQLFDGGSGAAPRSGPEFPFGPSDLNEKPYCSRAMTVGQIHDLVEAFALAAKRAVWAGFDVLQLHGAHGYLLSQFFSPLYNRRTDRYGGSALNRGRLALEILEAVRAAVSDETVLSLKINNQDYLPGGLTIEDSRLIAKELQAQGLDLVEVSGGLPQAGQLGPIRPRPEKIEDEAPFAAAAAYFKEQLKIPVYVVGAIRSLSVAKKIIEEGAADGLSLSRPLIREPDLAARWLAGQSKKADCLSCNACFKAAIKGPHGLYCPLAQVRS